MNELRQAAQLIRERGIAKNTAEDVAGHVCVGGALSLAMYGNAWTWGHIGRTTPFDFYDPTGRTLDPRFLALIGLAGQVVAMHMPMRAVEGTGASGTGVTTCDIAVRANNHPDTTTEEMAQVLEEAARILDADPELAPAPAETVTGPTPNPLTASIVIDASFARLTKMLTVAGTEMEVSIDKELVGA